MKRIKAVLPVFFTLLIVSTLILLISQNPLTEALQFMTLPLQKWVFLSANKSSDTATSEDNLQKENNQLRVELAQMQEIQKDNQALHDQFQTVSPSSQNLLPADVIGIQQNALFIDKGEYDHVRVGDVVVMKDNLVGKIIKITPNISQVTLLTDPSTAFTAETVKTSATGIINPQDGGTVIFGNVVLTDKLELNDIVVTKGDQDLQGRGFPPHLVVGKIVSVNKQASSLFQAAKVQSLFDVSQLRMVFVIVK